MTDPSRKTRPRHVAGLRAPDRGRVKRGWSDRHPEIRAARIAAAAGLVGAIIGAMLSAIPVLVASRTQLDAEYLRPQRQAAYVQFITNAEALDDAEDRLWGTVKNQEKFEDGIHLSAEVIEKAPYWSNKHIPNFDASLEERQAALEKLQSSSELVQLVGSEEAKEAAYDIEGDHYVLVLSDCGSQPWPDCDKLIIKDSERRHVNTDSRPSIREFKDIARRDLAS